MSGHIQIQIQQLGEALTTLSAFNPKSRAELDEWYKQARRLENCDTVLWCGHFHETFDAGPRLSTELIKQVADFEFDIIISTYFHSQQESNEVTRI